MNAETTTQGALSVQALSKSYRLNDRSFTVLQDIDLQVASGEFLSIVGPSGCGKSTLLRLIVGLDEDYEGEILLDGSVVRSTSLDRGIVFQDHRLLPWKTVLENVELALLNGGQPKARRREIAREYLELVRLQGFEQAYPAQLSGGMAQRAAIARALVNHPKVLLLDEPLGALDKRLRESLQLELRRIHRELGVTIIFVTHDQDEALTLSDRIVVFREGAVEQIGTPQDLYDRPGTEFVATFLGDSNIFDGKMQGGIFTPTEPYDGARFAPFLAVADGAVKVLVRPENLGVRAQDPEAGAENSVPVIIEDVVFSGATQRVEGRTAAGHQLVVRTRADAARVRIGDRVWFVWDSSASRVFPAEVHGK